MKSSNKLLLAILGSIVISGCSLTPGKTNDGNCVTVTAYLPPVVADLDYKDINGSRNQVIVQGGFQHALSIQGGEKSIGQMPPIEHAIRDAETVFFEFDRSYLPGMAIEKLTNFLKKIDPQKLT
jgi:hypothetical protein